MKSFICFTVITVFFLARFAVAQTPVTVDRPITPEELVRMSGNVLGGKYIVLNSQDAIPADIKLRIGRQLFDLFHQSGKLVARKLLMVDTLARQRSKNQFNNGGVNKDEMECCYLMLSELKTNINVPLVFRACFTSKGELMYKETLADIVAQSNKILPAGTAGKIATADAKAPVNSVCDMVLYYNNANRCIVWVITEQPNEFDPVQNMTVLNASTGAILQRNKIGGSDQYRSGPQASLNYIRPLNHAVPYREGKLWGYADSARKIIIPLRYQGAGFFQQLQIGEKKFRFAIVQLNQKYGLINQKGEPLTECIYDTVFKDYATGLLILKKGVDYLNYFENKIFLPAPSGELAFFQRKVTGVVNYQGYTEHKQFQILTPDRQQYQVIQTISSDADIRSKSDTINVEALELKKSPVRQDVFFIKKSTGWGVVSFDKRENVQPEYDSLYALTYFTIAVKKRGDWALLHLPSQNKTAYQYQEIIPNKGTSHIIKRNNKWGIKTDKLEVLLTTEPITSFDWIGDDLLMARILGLHDQVLGFADIKGTTYWK